MEEERQEEEKAYRELQDGLDLLKRGHHIEKEGGNNTIAATLLKKGFESVTKTTTPGSPTANALRRRSLRVESSADHATLNHAMEVVGNAVFSSASLEEGDTPDNSPPSKQQQQQQQQQHERRSSYDLHASGRSALSNLGSMYELLTRSDHDALPEHLKKVPSSLTILRNLDDSTYDQEVCLKKQQQQPPLGSLNKDKKTGIVEVTCIFTELGSLGLKLQKFTKELTSKKNVPEDNFNYSAEVCSIQHNSMAMKANVPLHSLVAGVNSRSVRGWNYTKVMDVIKKAASKRPLTIIFRVPNYDTTTDGSTFKSDNHEKLKSFVQSLRVESTTGTSKSVTGAIMDRNNKIAITTEPPPPTTTTTTTTTTLPLAATTTTTLNSLRDQLNQYEKERKIYNVEMERKILEIVDNEKQITILKELNGTMEKEIHETNSKYNNALKQKNEDDMKYKKNINQLTNSNNILKRELVITKENLMKENENKLNEMKMNYDLEFQSKMKVLIEEALTKEREMSDEKNLLNLKNEKERVQQAVALETKNIKDHYENKLMEMEQLHIDEMKEQMDTVRSFISV
jgi:hypothetical protein